MTFNFEQSGARIALALQQKGNKALTTLPMEMRSKKLKQPPFSNRQNYFLLCLLQKIFSLLLNRRLRQAIQASGIDQGQSRSGAHQRVSSLAPTHPRQAPIDIAECGTREIVR